MSIHQERLYDVLFQGDEKDIYSDDILFTASIDQDLWSEWQRGVRRNRPINHGWRTAPICCTPPWIAHVVFFAPILWCLPMTYLLICSPYKVLAPPSFDDALVLTTHGVHVHYNNQGDARVGIKWKNVDVEKISIVKGKMNRGLNTPIGFGLLLPCCFYHLSCCGPYEDRLYTITIPSIYNESTSSPVYQRPEFVNRCFNDSCTILTPQGCCKIFCTQRQRDVQPEMKCGGPEYIESTQTLLSVCALNVDAEDLLSKIKSFKERYH